MKTAQRFAAPNPPTCALRKKGKLDQRSWAQIKCINVVDPDNGMPLSQQSVGQMGADESGHTGDVNFHVLKPSNLLL
jgi:hypothetical protein